MTWAYLIVFNDALGSRQDVQDFLDTIPEITHWYSCMPNCVFFTSTLAAKSIADEILSKFGKGGGQRFLVVEAHKDRQGWLSKEAWHLFTNPEAPRIED